MTGAILAFFIVWNLVGCIETGRAVVHAGDATDNATLAAVVFLVGMLTLCASNVALFFIFGLVPQK